MRFLSISLLCCLYASGDPFVAWQQQASNASLVQAHLLIMMEALVLALRH